MLTNKLKIIQILNYECLCLSYTSRHLESSGNAVKYLAVKFLNLVF